MLVAGAVHVAGELLFAAASWGLSIPLTPRDAPGEATARMPVPAPATPAARRPRRIQAAHYTS